MQQEAFESRTARANLERDLEAATKSAEAAAAAKQGAVSQFKGMFADVIEKQKQLAALTAESEVRPRSRAAGTSLR